MKLSIFVTLIGLSSASVMYKRKEKTDASKPDCYPNDILPDPNGSNGPTNQNDLVMKLERELREMNNLINERRKKIKELQTQVGQQKKVYPREPVKAEVHPAKVDQPKDQKKADQQKDLNWGMILFFSTQIRSCIYCI